MSTTTQVLNNSNMNNLQKGASSTTADIQNLQGIETELLQNLEMNLAQGNLTANEVDSAISQINAIASMRMNLYDSLGNYNEFYQTNLQMANDTLYQQTQVLDILEGKLNDNRKKIIALAENKNNNVRLAEINSYYSEKYKAQARFMKIVIILILPILICAILVKRGLLPYIVFKIVSVIIGMIAFFFLVNQLYFFSTRNNMAYQQTNMQFNTSKLNTTSAFPDVSGNDPWFTGYNDSGVCKGSNCCSTGMTYDSSLNQCVEVESFVNLNPANTPSLRSYSSQSNSKIPSPALGNSKTGDSPLVSKNLDYNSYKNETNKKSSDALNWDSLLSSFDNLISSKKADYTMGKESFVGYNS
jgi:hypothetical protein